LTAGLPVSPTGPGPEDAEAARLRRLIWRPSGHWVVFALMMLGLLVSLVFQGYSRHTLGRSGTVAIDRSPVVGLGSAGPIVDLSGAKVRSVGPSAGQIALTFDDGPDPTWTPRVLAVLRRYHVPATFFVIGSSALSYPGLVRRELAAGADVGSHTYTHLDLGQHPGLRATVELSLTQSSLAGAAGINTALLRLPYSSTPADVTLDQYRAAKAAAHFGYLTVFATIDTRDWSRPGVARIVAAAEPVGQAGAVIMFHDGGGNRAQTVAALSRLIPALQARGDRFVTVSTMAGLSHRAVDIPVSGAARSQGRVLIWLLRVSVWVVDLVLGLTIPMTVLSLGRALLAFLLARRHHRRVVVRGPTAADDDEALLPPVSVLVPAYNEEVGIARTVESLLASDYPELEVIVIDDGSTDRTAEVAGATRHPSVRVVSQVNQGKPAALNRGVMEAKHPLIVMMDGDTIFQPDTIRELVAPLVSDAGVGAVSGNTKVGNRRGLLGLWQHTEYVIGFSLDRRMWDSLHCIPTIPGAIGAFRRDVLDAVGGMSDDTLAEDTDLTMTIQRHGWRVVYRPGAIAWTEAPLSLSALWRQRYRWGYGTLQAMWKHKAAVFEPAPLGRLGLPYMLIFQIVLPTLAPVIDVFALYGLLFLNVWSVAGIWVGYNILQLLLGIYAFKLDREPLRPLWTLPLQQLVYRQMVYLVVIQSVTSALSGVRLRWHKLERTGLDPLPG
jgi:cellulose synthase/poly-beta-1,6-N-acetylglucosamine synthase-like glycosyltransferase/peptidoglycan/xylan/chitin deacetylase (PgdA/CDA1 family)